MFRSIKSEKNPNQDDKAQARGFVWKRVYARLILYLIALLIVVFLLSKPVESLI